MRDEFMRALYTAHFDAVGFNWNTWAEGRKVPREQALSVFEELHDEGLVEPRTIGGGTDITPAGILYAEERNLASAERIERNKEIRFLVVDALDRGADNAGGWPSMGWEQLVAAAGVTKQEFFKNLDLLKAADFFQNFSIGRYSLTRTGREWLEKCRERRAWAADAEAKRAAGDTMASLKPEGLKLVLLKVLSDKPLRHHHRNNIIGQPLSQGEIERLLKRVLEPAERALAGQLLRELEDAGLARPTYRNVADPANWIEITDAGTAALETGVLDPLDGVLKSIDSHLLQIRRGAWSALRSGQPDSLRQAAHSVRELIDQVLKATAPDEEVRNEPGFRPDPSSSSGVTRRMRLRLAMRKYRGTVSDSELDMAVKASDLVLAVDNRLTGLAHSRTAPSREDVKDSLEAAELALRRLLLKVDE